MNKTTRFIALVLTLVMVMGTLAVLPFGTFAYSNNDKDAPGSGAVVPDNVPVYDGTPSIELTKDADGAYLINSVADFVYFQTTAAAVATADDVFKLTVDIALNNADYGTGNKHNSLGNPANFAGLFDGQGHKVYNIYSTGNAAWFNDLTGAVKNVTLVSPRVYGSVNTSLMAVNLYGRIENVHVENAYLKGKDTAGLVHTMCDGSTVYNCSVSGEINATGNAGGIANHRAHTRSDTIVISNCVNRASVTTTGNAAAGIMPGADNNWQLDSGYIFTGCTNYGDVTATNLAGGIFAQSYRSGCHADFLYCTNYGNITTTAATGGNAGGIAAEVPKSGSNKAHAQVNLIGCTNRGDVTTNGIAGGMIGSNISTGILTNIVDCTNYGNVTGNTFAGGMVGKTYSDHSHGPCRLSFTNSANHGNVSAAVSGGILGQFVAQTDQSSSVAVNGFLSTGDVTGTAKASAVVGEFNYNYQNAATTRDFTLTNVWLQGKVSVAEGGVVAAFIAGSSTTKTAVAETPVIVATGCGFDLTFEIADAVATAVSAYNTDGTARIGYNNGTEDVAEAYPVAVADTFAADALASLNAVAGDNCSWKADDTYMAVHIRTVIALANALSLDRNYTGRIVDAAYTVFDENVKSVTVVYYKTSDLTTPLSGAPALPGDYRVILQGKNAVGENYGDSVTQDYTIHKGKVSFKLTEESLVGFTAGSAYDGSIKKYSINFNGRAFDYFVATAYAVTDGYANGEDVQCGLTPVKYTKADWRQTPVESVLHAGDYYVHFSFEGNDLYEATTARFTINVNKATFTYPAADTEGRWNIPVGSNGTEQQPTLNFLEGEAPAEIFDITYGGDYTATYMADGETQNATATLALKAEFANDCTVEGTSPSYATDWHLNTAVGFSGATMSLGGNMALNMKLAEDVLAWFGEGYTVAFVDAANIGKAASLDGNGYYSASYENIRAADLAEEMQLHVVITANGKTYTSNNVLTYSPAIYLANIYTKHAEDTAAIEVVKNMFAYGIAAEAKDAGIEVTETATAAVATAAGIDVPTVFSYTEEHLSDTMTEADKSAINAIADTGAALTGGINITFTVKDSRYTTLTVDGVVYTAQDGKFEITCLYAGMIRNTLRLTFSGEGAETVTANFVIGNFLEGRRADAGEKQLAEATIMYMMSVRAYILATEG